MGMRTIVLCTLLAVFLSCGESENRSDVGDRHDKLGAGCRLTTSRKDSQEFIEKVKRMDFEPFSSRDCWEFSQIGQTQRCKWWGCYGFTYNRPEGAVPCSSGASHEQSLIDLVSVTLTNFEAEICGDKMVRAKIAVGGKGIRPDYHVFDFELPARFNPIRQEIWRDEDKKYRITVRQ